MSVAEERIKKLEEARRLVREGRETEEQRKLRPVTEERILKLEDDIAFLTSEIADLRRNINRLRKAPAIYTTFAEYDREEPSGS